MDEEKTQQGPIRYSTDDALRLLYALGYEQRFSQPLQRAEFRSVFPGVYENCGYDFLFSICLAVGRKIPLMRIEKRGDFRFESGQYRRFGDDFDARFQERFGAAIEDGVTLDQIVKKLRTEIDIDKPAGSDEDDEDSGEAVDDY
ncbi:hypothetical protein GF371_04340 [Candidatus Woesearchaeota archaeon]|nr:hypothetical protein [Candidatus Woesearchaeota archaeon]